MTESGCFSPLNSASDGRRCETGGASNGVAGDWGGGGAISAVAERRMVSDDVEFAAKESKGTGT